MSVEDGARLSSAIEGILSGELKSATEALRGSMQNLPPLALHIQQSYRESLANETTRAAAFNQAKTYSVQALASVAFQIQQVSTHFLELLDKEFELVQNIDGQLRVPKEKATSHEEQLARRAVALIAKKRSRPRGRKLTKPEVENTAKTYVRRALDFDALDEVGHGEISAKSAFRDPTATIEKRYAPAAIKVPPAAPLKTSSRSSAGGRTALTKPQITATMPVVAPVAPTVPGGVVTSSPTPVAPTAPAAPAAPGAKQGPPVASKPAAPPSASNIPPPPPPPAAPSALGTH